MTTDRNPYYRRRAFEAIALAGATFSCSPNVAFDSAQDDPLSSGNRARVEQAFANGRWSEAIDVCNWNSFFFPNDCEARYCTLLGRTMVVVDSVNDYLLPKFRSDGKGDLWDLLKLAIIDGQLRDMSNAAAEVTSRHCSYDLPHLPLRIGDAVDPIVLGDVRGRHTPREAYLLSSIATSTRYLLATITGRPPLPPPPPGETTPALPELLEQMRVALLAHDSLLFSTPVTPDPALPVGGWWDKDGDGMPSAADELLIDIFEPGTDDRVFDFSGAELVRGESLPLGALTRTEDLPPARCGYERWHIDTLFSGNMVGTDGMSFLPDGSKVVVPIKVDGTYQVHLANLDGSNPVCMTCGIGGANDGVRWRPGSPDTMIFLSTRDHPHGIGGAGGGPGLEIYAMRSDGAQLTRLTHTGTWATNYHVNWSADGRQLVWGSSEERTYDVMVADFVDDATGMRLANIRRLTRDTTWWETHGFSADGSAVITTNTRMGLLSPDLFAIDVATGTRTRLTDHPAWDEHAHLSPEGRKLVWMSGRARPASVLRLDDGSISPIFDFWWITTGTFFQFVNAPAGYATELYIMDADGNDVRQLTFDGQVIADNQWSADGTKIIFRQTDTSQGIFGSARIRVLSFDDCD